MDIFNISFDGGTKIIVSVNWIAIVILIVLVIVAAHVLKKVGLLIGRRSISVDQANIGIGNSSVTLKFNKKDQEIAYKLWVELSTRKIGLPFDQENDVISEVYNSWYDFFKIARELLKEIPVSRLPYSNDLIKLTEKVLNTGLRPHLTMWQAKFRKWYGDNINDNNKEKTPQQIQMMYPDYEELKKDLIETNTRMIEYKKLMERIAFEK